MFSSLSKRSNVPGMRSGFVAGDASILKAFLLYRTYHGCAMNPAIQAASIAAWSDDAHVLENRRQYSEKFAAVTPLLGGVLGTGMPVSIYGRESIGSAALLRMVQIPRIPVSPARWSPIIM